MFSLIRSFFSVNIGRYAPRNVVQIEVLDQNEAVAGPHQGDLQSPESANRGVFARLGACGEFIKNHSYLRIPLRLVTIIGASMACRKFWKPVLRSTALPLKRLFMSLPLKLKLSFIPLFIVSSGFCVGTGILVTRTQAGKWVRSALSKRIYQTGTISDSNSTTIRTSFRQVALPAERSNDTTHTHGKSAMSRSAVSAHVDHICAISGLTPFYFQMSLADVRLGRKGCRDYYWAKDVSTPASDETPGSRDALVLIDVDYYVDINDLLLNHFSTTFIYAVQPNTVAATEDEYSFTFGPDSVITYMVTGGATYSHKVWNYSTGDSIMVSGWIIQHGLPSYVTRTYLVERKSAGGAHELVVMAPLRSWSGADAVAARLLLEGGKIKRYDVIRGQFTVLGSMSKGRHTVSIGRVSEYNAGTVSRVHFDALECKAREVKNPIKPYHVKSLCPGETGQEHDILIAEYMQQLFPRKPLYVHPISMAIMNYDYCVTRTEPIRQSLQAFMSPVIHGVYAPVNSAATDAAAVKGRITSVRPPFLTASPIMSKCMIEFAQAMAPGKFLEPVSIDEVFIRQSRPQQRSILERAEFEKPTHIVQTFVKKEPYDGPKDPRLITQMCAYTKLHYSRYLYAISDYMKEFDWYAFGVPPSEICAKVAEITSNADWVINSDFSRFDGRVSNLIRDMEAAVAARFFGPDHIDTFKHLHSLNYKNKAYTSNGIQYNTEYARASGSPETSVFNTLTNKFIVFYVLRLAGNPPLEAFNWPGIYGGDDGLTPNVNPEIYKRGGDDWGQSLTLEPIQRGEFGVTFLSRYYTRNVWNGDQNSCCDLRRQLIKLHTTAACYAKPYDKLHAKMLSYSSTDRHSPILGPLIMKFFQLHVNTGLNKLAERHLSYWYTEDLTKQYVNEHCDDFEELLDSQIPDIDREVLERFLEGVTEARQLLRIPLLNELAAPVAASVELIVNDELVAPVENVPVKNAEADKKVVEVKAEKPRPVARNGKPEQPARKRDERRKDFEKRNGPSKAPAADKTDKKKKVENKGKGRNGTLPIQDKKVEDKSSSPEAGSSNRVKDPKSAKWTLRKKPTSLSDELT